MLDVIDHDATLGLVPAEIAPARRLQNDASRFSHSSQQGEIKTLAARIEVTGSADSIFVPGRKATERGRRRMPVRITGNPVGKMASHAQAMFTPQAPRTIRRNEWKSKRRGRVFSIFL